jgi:hypothetical protein
MYGTNNLYAKHHEYGTGPHAIYPKNKKALSWAGAGITGPVLRGVTGRRKGNSVFARKVNHPGTAGRFYMRNSRIKVQAALPKIGTAVLQRIAKRWAGGG